MKYERVTKRTLAYVITYELWNYGEPAGIAGQFLPRL